MIKQSFLDVATKENESFIADFIETNGRMNFRYQEKLDDANVQIMAEADNVEIVRHGEAISHIRLKLEAIDKVLIDSPFGQMEMESYTINIVKSPNVLLVEYQLLQEKQVIGHFKITWQILKEDMS